MASEKVQNIVEAMETLSLLELVELKKTMEDRWGVTAAAPMMAMAAMPGVSGDGGAAPAAPVEEQTEFDVILTEIGANKIQVIKVVRELTGLGLKEAKDLVEGAPKPVKEAVSKEDAEAAKAKLVDVGAQANIK